MPRGNGEDRAGGGRSRRVRVDRIVLNAPGGETPSARELRRAIRAELRRRFGQTGAVEGLSPGRHERIRVDAEPEGGNGAEEIARQVADAVQRAGSGPS